MEEKEMIKNALAELAATVKDLSFIVGQVESGWEELIEEVEELKEFLQQKKVQVKPKDPHPEFPVDPVLYESLRSLRYTISQEKEVPPYIVFPNRTLAEMSARKPETLEALGQINGVGENKLRDYGQRFLKAITDYNLSQQLTLG